MGLGWADGAFARPLAGKYRGFKTEYPLFLEGLFLGELLVNRCVTQMLVNSSGIIGTSAKDADSNVLIGFDGHEFIMTFHGIDEIPMRRSKVGECWLGESFLL